MAEPTNKEADLLDKIDRGLAQGEAFLLVVVLTTMFGLSLLQTFLRKFFDYGFEWADIIVRQMVLWVAFLGGALATYKGRHIAIDAACKLLSDTKAAALRTLTSLVAAVISGILVVASWQFILDEIEDETMIFGPIPAWAFEVIIPAAFIAITFHFLMAARLELLTALKKRAGVPAHRADSVVEAGFESGDERQ